MENDELRSRIQAASDDNEELHAAYKTGAQNDIDYYVVVVTKQHDNSPMLKLRYFALHRDNPNNDTWMKNGLTARNGDELLHNLAKDLQHVHNGITGDDGPFFGRDLTEE